MAIDLSGLITASMKLDAAKTQQIDKINASCKTEIYTGYLSNALGAPYRYPAQDTDQRNMISSVTKSMLPGLVPGWTIAFPCADANGVWADRPHTAAQIQQAGSDGFAAINAAREKNAALVAQIMAATTIAEVQAVTW